MGIGAIGTLLAFPAAAQAEDIPVTNLNDTGAGSLREALDEANTDSDLDRILFKSKLSGTIHLTAPLAFVFYPVNIVGPGARKVSVDAGNYRHFIINSSADGTTISGLTLTGGNTGDEGGAISSFGDLTLSNTTVSGNTADAGGGGIHATFDSDLVIRSSTISGNIGGTGGGDYGGGILVNDGAALSLIDSTVSGNSAGEDGGGIYITGGADSEIRNSTITANTAVEDDAGGVWAFDSPTSLRGTIVAGNEAGNGTHDLVSVNDPFTSAFSLIGDTTQSVVSPPIVDEGGNLFDVDPNLKPLKNNGGPTDTHAFKKSPVKNKIPKSQSEKKDQRGAPRKGKGDIGAYELVKCEGVVVNRVGTAGKDKLKGTKKKDGILGLGGNDKLSGKKGKDGLCGGSGKDKLKGGPGKDKLNGGPGKDKEIQ
jgi:parallel beta-helix repeat protein